MFETTTVVYGFGKKKVELAEFQGYLRVRFWMKIMKVCFENICLSKIKVLSMN